MTMLVNLNDRGCDWASAGELAGMAACQVIPGELSPWVPGQKACWTRPES